LVEEVLQLKPPDTLALTYPVISWFELSAATDQDDSDLTAMLEAQGACLQQGISAVRLTSVSEQVAKLGIGYTIGNSTPWNEISVEETVDKIFAFTQPGIVPDDVTFAQKDMKRLGNNAVVMLEADALINRWGWWYTNVDGRWITDGYAFVLGAWSTFTASVSPNEVPIQGVGCPPRAFRSWGEASKLLSRLGQTYSEPRFDDGMEVLFLSTSTPASAGNTQQVTDVVDAYRQCLLGGETPAEFAWSTDEFFWENAQRDADGNLEIPANVQALTSSAQSAIPSGVERVVQRGDNRAIAILETNSQWAEKYGGNAGILLVNQNGQWLIDQMVLVQDS
jgi:hypothetical protein